MRFLLPVLFLLFHVWVQATERDEEARRNDSIAIAQLKINIRSIWQSDPDSALLLTDKLDDLSILAKDSLAKAFAILYKGNLKEASGDTLEAIGLFVESAKWYASAGRAGYGSILFQDVGDLYKQMGEVNKAIQHYRFALDMNLLSFDLVNDRRRSHKQLQRLRDIHEETNRIHEHETYLDSFFNHKNLALRYHIRLDEGNIMFYNGNIARSIDHVFKALDHALKLNSAPLIWRAYATLGFVLPDYDKKKKYNELALAIMDTFEGPTRVIMQINNMALAAFDDERWEDARRISRSQILINDTGSIHLPWHYVRPYNMVAACYLYLGDPKRALEVSDTAMSHITNPNWHEFLLTTLATRAAILFELGDIDAAYRTITRAESSLQKANLDSKYQTSPLNLYRQFHKIAAAKGLHKEALRTYTEYIDIKDSLKSERSIKSMIQKDMEFQMQQEAIQDSLAKAAELEEEQQALAIEEQNKAYRNRIQISGVILFVLFLLSLIVLSGRLNIGPRTAEGLIFVFFILLFEFILVVMDPWVDVWSDGQVIIKLGINSSFALLVFFGHHFFAGKLKEHIRGHIIHPGSKDQ
jgi:tetratricopeptide (TPR) repeat protein